MLVTLLEAPFSEQKGNGAAAERPRKQCGD